MRECWHGLFQGFVRSYPDEVDSAGLFRLERNPDPARVTDIQTATDFQKYHTSADDCFPDDRG